MVWYNNIRLITMGLFAPHLACLAKRKNIGELMTSREEELKDLLEIYKRNLHMLELQRARYGHLNSPIALENQISELEKRIEALQEAKPPSGMIASGRLQKLITNGLWLIGLLLVGVISVTAVLFILNTWGVLAYLSSLGLEFVSVLIVLFIAMGIQMAILFLRWRAGEARRKRLVEQIRNQRVVNGKDDTNTKDTQ